MSTPKRKRGVSPADRLISSLDGTYYKTSEAAELVEISEITLRRLIHKNRVKAPTHLVRQGKAYYYLFTPEDIEELRDYYGHRGTVERRVVDNG